MKKVILGTLVLGAIAFTSCEKCKTCTKSGYEDQIECKGSGPLSKSVWEDELNYWREQGYQCD